MTNRGLTYDMLEFYFRDLVRKNRLINSFAGFTDAEFEYVIADKKANKYPMLALSRYAFKLSGNKQRTFNERVIEFGIGIKLKNRSFDEERKAEAFAEQLGMQMIARIKEDSDRCESLHWLYGNFDVNTVKAQALPFDTKDRIKGMSFSFELKNRQPLLVEDYVWTDKSRLSFTSGFSAGFR